MEKNTSILLVEDNPQDIAIITKALNTQYHIYAAKNSHDAKEILERNMIHLILMDINIPGISGLELAKSLKTREETAGIPIIFVTAYENTEKEIAALDTGAYDFISKPINPIVLRKRVHIQRQLDQALNDAHERAKQLEDNLKLHEMVDSMSYHDMKNLLIPLINLPEMMSMKMKEISLSEDDFSIYMEKKLMDIKNISYRILDMINRIHDLYLMENGRYELSLEIVNCNKILYELTGTLQTIIREKSLSIAITIDNIPVSPDDEFNIEGEEYLFHNTFMNLMKNAVEASREGDTISVDMNRKLKKIAFHNSKSIPEEIRKEFFNKFTTSGKVSGTGLGTYIVKLMVELMNGNVSFVTGKAEGTIVTLDFSDRPEC